MMTTISASDVLALVPQLRAFAICLVEDEAIADALVEMALICTWNDERDTAGEDTRMLLFRFLHREFHAYESTRALAQLPARTPVRSHRAEGGDIARLLRELSPDQREIILLVDACGFMDREVARILGCDVASLFRELEGAYRSLTSALALACWQREPTWRQRHRC